MVECFRFDRLNYFPLIWFDVRDSAHDTCFACVWINSTTIMLNWEWKNVLHSSINKSKICIFCCCVVLYENQRRWGALAHLVQYITLKFCRLGLRQAEMKGFLFNFVFVCSVLLFPTIGVSNFIAPNPFSVYISVYICICILSGPHDSCIWLFMRWLFSYRTNKNNRNETFLHTIYWVYIINMSALSFGQ